MPHTHTYTYDIHVHISIHGGEDRRPNEVLTSFTGLNSYLVKTMICNMFVRLL